ncbi:MAG TPA: PD-(D/E)XK nuclease family protein [Candidatus Levybacteria bacterium]|nr:PD-(D/E)XK nuclease family protein [Candidatus Levybacteria bacterium]
MYKTLSSYEYRFSPLFNPKSTEPYKISRSKIDLFMQCPRCFYLDRRLGIARPSMPTFTLNNTVDTLLKKEFDLLRANSETHELMKKYKIDAVPFKHPEIDRWRENFKGKSYHERDTNFIVAGAIDDVWQNKKEELLIVDYKATSTDRTINLNDEYKESYKRQMEIYQWIFRNSGYKVSHTGYFVFANARRNRARFDGKLEFDLSIISYTGDTSWISSALQKIRIVLTSDTTPDFTFGCDYCDFVRNQTKKSKKEPSTHAQNTLEL